MASDIPPTAKGRDSKERILNAARIVFAEKGYLNARVQDIAHQAGFALGNTYRYFDSKDDIFAAVLQHLHADLLEATRTRSAGMRQSDLASAIHSANENFLAYWHKQAGILRAIREASSTRW